MKVLMKEEVKKVGKKGQIVEVSDGYGANFLIPNKYAVLYTAQAQKEYDKEQAELARVDAEKRAEAKKLVETLKGITLEFEASAGRQGYMIGTVSTKEIIKSLKEKHGIVINKNQIVDKDVIVNGFGKTAIKVDLYKGVIGEVNIHVSLKEKK